MLARGHRKHRVREILSREQRGRGAERNCEEHIVIRSSRPILIYLLPTTAELLKKSHTSPHFFEPREGERRG
jgi:hypothetical protein